MAHDAPQVAPVALIIRDGWGENPHREHDAFNAIRIARTPAADRLAAAWPHALIHTSGEHVGLPGGTIGNSEVGHQNIGAGRVVLQEIMRITAAVRDGTFFENEALLGAFGHASRSGGAVHFMGLVSDGQVHSDLDHLFALIDLAKRASFPADRVFVHAFTDGRDTGPHAGLGYLERLEEKLRRAGTGRIASVCGRYYAMDRDHRWDRVARAYEALTGDAARTALTAAEAVRHYYDHPTEVSRVGDEFVLPTQIIEHGRPVARIRDGDAVIFFNFRGDRPRELTYAFVLDDDAWRRQPEGVFERGRKLENLCFCTMTRYEEGLPVTAVAFPKAPRMNGLLGEVIADAGLTQFRCAETEKFPHVTFFFNDYQEQPFPGERRLLVPSPKDVSTYDQKPEMSAEEVCRGVLARLDADDCEPLIVVNFANGDMVGHTGNLNAVVRAVEVVDDCVGRIVDAVLARGGAALVTADHGNAEQMWDPRHDCAHTAHTLYDVPLIACGEPFRGRTLLAGGRLADLAPTVLEIMDLEPPAEMDGRSLIAPAPARL